MIGLLLLIFFVEFLLFLSFFSSLFILDSKNWVFLVWFLGEMSGIRSTCLWLYNNNDRNNSSELNLSWKSGRKYKEKVVKWIVSAYSFQSFSSSSSQRETCKIVVEMIFQEISSLERNPKYNKQIYWLEKNRVNRRKKRKKNSFSLFFLFVCSTPFSFLLESIIGNWCTKRPPFCCWNIYKLGAI